MYTKIVQKLKRFHHAQQFRPSWYGVFINPFYISRKGLSDAIERHSKSLQGKLLDVGCGTKPYKSFFHVEAYIGLELESEKARSKSSADIYYDGNKFPFQSECFDSVLCNQVLEHVFNPTEFLAEVNRVLHKKGILLLTVPFLWDEHEQPNDYARYSSFGLRSLLEASGFKILKHEKITTDIRSLFQLINAYIYKIISSKSKILKHINTILMHSVITILGIVFNVFTPKNEDVYLDQIIIAVKK